MAHDNPESVWIVGGIPSLLEFPRPKTRKSLRFEKCDNLENAWLQQVKSQLAIPRTVVSATCVNTRFCGYLLIVLHSKLTNPIFNNVQHKVIKLFS
jgi:hypothetical protein